MLDSSCQCIPNTLQSEIANRLADVRKGRTNGSANTCNAYLVQYSRTLFALGVLRLLPVRHVTHGEIALEVLIGIASIGIAQLLTCLACVPSLLAVASSDSRLERILRLKLIVIETLV
jgi:hypothetical protein